MRFILVCIDNRTFMGAARIMLYRHAKFFSLFYLTRSNIYACEDSNATGCRLVKEFMPQK